MRPLVVEKLCLTRVRIAGNVLFMNTLLESNENSAVNGQIVGYARVSSTSQHLDRQLQALLDAGCEKIFQEKVSGASRERPELINVLDYLRDGDKLVCVSMDRLARSLGDLHNIVSELTQRGVTVQFLKEAQTYSRDSSPVSKLMLGLLGSIAEFERSLIRERQAEGIAKAKERGVYKGRSKSLTESEAQALVDAASRGVSKSRIARDFGVSRATVYRYLAQTDRKSA